jgi:hypothetical protein
MGSIVSIGVDIGQKVDPTAIAVVEAVRRGPDGEWAFLTRHLERLELGTPYRDVASRTPEVVAGVRERMIDDDTVTRGRLERGGITLYVDATGVGAPIVEMLKERIAPRSCTIRAVYFTHGDKLTRREDGLSLGKAYLVSRLQALIQSGRIELPRTRQAEELAEELLDYEIRVDEDGNDKYGAFKVGAHDDLVTALGLAVLKDPREPRPVRAYSTRDLSVSVPRYPFSRS